MYKRECPYCAKQVSYGKLNSLFLCGHCFKSIAISEANGKHALTLDQYINLDTCEEVPKLTRSKVLLEKVSFKSTTELDVEVRESIPIEESLLGPLSDRKKKRASHVKLFCVMLVIVLLFIVALVSKFWIGDRGGEGQVQNREKVENEGRQELPPLYLRLADHKDAQKALEKFFAARSLKEAEQYVLPDPSLPVTFKQYWKPRSFEQIKHIVKLSRVLDNKTGVIHFFNCENKDGRSFHYPVYSFNGNSNYYVGWRVAEQIEETSIEDIVTQKLKGNLKIRCLLVQENYYNHGYTPEEWVSLGCYNSNASLESYVSLRCYLSRKGSIYDSINKAMRNESGREIKEIIYTDKDIEDNKRLVIPQTLYELETKEDLTSTKPYTHCIVEIKIVDAERGVSEIVSFVCETLEEYFTLYQEPYLKKVGIIRAE